MFEYFDVFGFTQVSTLIVGKVKNWCVSLFYLLASSERLMRSSTSADTYSVMIYVSRPFLIMRDIGQVKMVLVSLHSQCLWLKRIRYISSNLLAGFAAWGIFLAIRGLFSLFGVWTTLTLWNEDKIYLFLYSFTFCRIPVSNMTNPFTVL